MFFSGGGLTNVRIHPQPQAHAHEPHPSSHPHATFMLIFILLVHVHIYIYMYPYTRSSRQRSQIGIARGPRKQPSVGLRQMASKSEFICRCMCTYLCMCRYICAAWELRLGYMLAGRTHPNGLKRRHVFCFILCPNPPSPKSNIY